MKFLQKILPKKVAILSEKGSAVLETVRQKRMSTNEIIEEIHETFFTEADRLLAQAKISHSLETDKQPLIDKRDRLIKLGFTNTKECKEAATEIKRLNALKTENKSKEGLVRAIDYFSFKYPNYKFITEESVKTICAKYNLVYGAITDYLGTVPTKNIEEMEKFKISPEDSCYMREKWFNGRQSEKRHYIDMSEYQREVTNLKNSKYGHYQITENVKECPLEIAAPIKDFNMEDKEVKDHKIFKLEIPDPVVLKPVYFERQKYYLIVTAWGLEASDELVINQKMN